MQSVARIAGILIQAFTLQDALNRIRRCREIYFFQRVCHCRKVKHGMGNYLEDFGSRYCYLLVYTEEAFVRVLREKWVLNNWWMCSDFFQHWV